MQGITNVMVTCCDGHSELAIKGDNGPNESSIAPTTYTIDKKDLGFYWVRGRVLDAAVQPRLRTHGRDLEQRACTVPNSNPTGSWEQVNTFVMPIPDPSSVFGLPGDGNSPGFKVEATGHAATPRMKSSKAWKTPPASKFLA